MSGDDLAAVNAVLNMASFLLLTAGWFAVKGGHTERHRKLMGTAFLTSGLFLITYLWRWSVTGTVHFSGTGGLKALYLLVLFTHVPLAIAVVPMAIVAIRRARSGDIDGHKRMTRKLFPIWSYVSLTGVIVYLMLYKLPGLPPRVVTPPLLGS